MKRRRERERESEREKDKSEVFHTICQVNITFKQGTMGLNEMYLQFIDNVALISWEKQSNASKYFWATVGMPSPGN